MSEVSCLPCPCSTEYVAVTGAYAAVLKNVLFFYLGHINMLQQPGYALGDDGLGRLHQRWPTDQDWLSKDVTAPQILRLKTEFVLFKISQGPASKLERKSAEISDWAQTQSLAPVTDIESSKPRQAVRNLGATQFAQTLRRYNIIEF